MHDDCLVARHPLECRRPGITPHCTWSSGGGNSSVGSVLGLLSCLMQHHGFDPPLRRIFPVEVIFPLELTWVLTPSPLIKTLRWAYKPRSSLCTHAYHRTDSKDPDIYVLDGWMLATKTHQACTIHQSGRWQPQWLDYGHISKNLTQMVNPRDVAGKGRRRSTWSSPTSDCKVSTPLAVIPDTWHCYIQLRLGQVGTPVALPLSWSLSSLRLSHSLADRRGTTGDFTTNFLHCSHRLAVKASTSRAEDPRFESLLCQDFFSGVESHQWLKNWPGVGILWLGKMESLVCNFYLSVAARKIVWADPSLRHSHVAGTLSNQQTNHPSRFSVAQPLSYILTGGRRAALQRRAWCGKGMVPFHHYRPTLSQSGQRSGALSC